VVDLVEDADARQYIGADFGQHHVGHFELALEAGVAGVDHVEQQRGIQCLVEGGLEGCDQAVGQVLDEAHRIADQHAGHAFRVQHAHGGVQRGEELVGDQHLAAGEGPHQGGLAGVGVADQRHRGEALAFLAAGALGLALDLHRVDFLLQLGDAVADLAAVQLGMGFAGTPADAAALAPLGPGQLGHLAQARRHVAEAGDFHLGPGRAGAGVAVEDLEDDHGAVHHLAAHFDFQVAGLEGEISWSTRMASIWPPRAAHRAPIDVGLDLLPLAHAQVGVGVEAGALLDEGVDHLKPSVLASSQLGQ
jgi:hypothetical protein